MAHLLNDIITDPTLYLHRLFKKIELIKLDVSAYYLDHLCYRVSSVDEYDLKKKDLFNHGTLLAESLVNGRPIATFKLFNPIKYAKREISVIELPSPKKNSPYPSGLEHAEFVVPHPLHVILKKYPSLPFDISGIDKKINADITLNFHGECIRFHEKKLEEIIRLEQNIFSENL